MRFAAVVATVLVLAGTAPVWSTAQAVGAAAASGEPAATVWPKSRVIRDLETLWEVPANPRGVLFVAHGCSHQGSDFWPASPRCPHCLGLPEEVAVREAALQRGYAVVAVTSFNRESRCWHNTQPSRSEDLKRLPDVLRDVAREEGLDRLPLYLFGASSGGGIVLRLAGLMQEAQGVVAQITPARPALLDTRGARRYPPALFVHMAQRDPEWAAQITEVLDYCRAEGIPAAEIRVAPQPVTPQLLLRSPQVGGELALEVVQALAEEGVLDEEGFLKEDPRSSDAAWRPALEPLVANISLEADASPIAQLLNVAYAQHEITSSSIGVSLAWLEAGGQVSLQELERREQQLQRRACT